MENIHFNTVLDIINYIKKNNFDRDLTSEIGMSYIYEENPLMTFNENSFEGLGFLFDFFNEEQLKLSDDSLKDIIESIENLENNGSALALKMVLYKKELKILEEKFSKNLISKEIYEQQKNKVLF